MDNNPVTIHNVMQQWHNHNATLTTSNSYFSLQQSPQNNIPDKKQTITTIQTTSLHWWNNWNNQEHWAATKVTMTIWKQMIEKKPDEPPEGSWWTKVPLGHVLPKGIHSCPIDKDKHLAAS